MAKDLSMMLLTCVVPTSRVHALDDFLEQAGAREIMWRPYRVNGAGADHGAKLSTHGKSETQQEWIKHNIKGDIKVAALKDLWVNAGFGKHSIYGALARAVQHKLIKKVKPGIYRGL